MGTQQQYLSGLFFIAFGALAVWAGRDLTIGTAADMGIGYTPRALAIGCVAVCCSCRRSSPRPPMMRCDFRSRGDPCCSSRSW